MGDYRTIEQYEDLLVRLRKGTLNTNDVTVLANLVDSVEDQTGLSFALHRYLADPTDTGRKAFYARFCGTRLNWDVLYEFLHRDMWWTLQRADVDPDRRSQFYAWPWTDGAIAAILAYQCTKQRRFLDLIVDTFDMIMYHQDARQGRIDEVRGRAMRSWGNRLHRADRWTTVVPTVGRIGYPVLEFCILVRDDPALGSVYGASASKYLAEIETGIAEFDADFRVSDKSGEGYYWRPALDDIEPINHAHCVGNTLILLYKLTGREEYLQKVDALARFFLSCVRRQPSGAWEWSYQPTPDNRTDHPPESTWKAAVTIEFPVLAQQTGLAFSQADMESLVQTFHIGVRRGQGRFNSTLSGEDTEFLEKDRRERQNILGWMCVAQFEPSIRKILVGALASRTDLFPNGWFSSLRTARAYVYWQRSLVEAPAAASETKVANDIPE